jgi:hypothetical protein
VPGGAPVAGLPVPVVVTRAEPTESVMLRSLRAAPLTVLGPVTGRRYAFAAGGVQAVDRRDAARLLGSSLFRRG